MDFVDRAWEALMRGDAAAAVDEMKYNEIARVRPLQRLAAGLAEMEPRWAAAWLDAPNGALGGATPRDALSRHHPETWERVADIFRRRDLHHHRSTPMRMEPGPERSDLSHLYGMGRAEVTAEVLGRRCAEARRAMGLTTAAAAQRCGVAETDLRRFEDRGDVDLRNALLIIDALSMDTTFENAFRSPRFANLDDLLAYAARTR